MCSCVLGGVLASWAAFCSHEGGWLAYVCNVCPVVSAVRYHGACPKHGDPVFPRSGAQTQNRMFGQGVQCFGGTALEGPCPMRTTTALLSYRVAPQSEILACPPGGAAYVPSFRVVPPPVPQELPSPPDSAGGANSGGANSAPSAQSRAISPIAVPDGPEDKKRSHSLVPQPKGAWRAGAGALEHSMRPPIALQVGGGGREWGSAGKVKYVCRLVLLGVPGALGVQEEIVCVAGSLWVLLLLVSSEGAWVPKDEISGGEGVTRTCRTAIVVFSLQKVSLLSIVPSSCICCACAQGCGKG